MKKTREAFNTRMIEAMELVENSHFTIGLIGTMVGYKTNQGFIRAFRRFTGMTPYHYREQYFGTEDWNRKRKEYRRTNG